MSGKHAYLHSKQLVLSLCCLVMGCRHDPQPSLSVQPPVLQQVQTQVNGHEHLRIRVQFPKTAFQTQAVDLSRIQYLRSWVRGNGIHGQVWNSEGFVKVSGNPQATLSMSGVPKGRQRLVAAQGYDHSNQPIPGTLLMAFYDSPEKSQTVTVYLKWRFVPIGSAMEYLLNTHSPLLDRLDLAALQRLLDQMIYGPNPTDGNVYAVHPSLLNPQAIVAYLEQHQGQLPATPPTTWLSTTPTQTLQVRNPQNISFNSPITVQVNDPASGIVTIGAGNDQTVLPAMAAGTWSVTASLAGLNGGVKAQTTATVASNGSVALESNPLLLPPVITSITHPPTPPVALPAGLISRWTAENHANDQLRNNSGQLKNGTTFAAGMTGQAFSFDGVDDFIAVDDSASHDFGTGGFTLSGWVKTASNSQNPLFSKYNNAQQGWMLAVHTGKSYFFNRNGAGVTVAEFFGAKPVADNQWHLITARRNGTQYCLFVDGYSDTCMVGAADNLDNSQPLYLGQYPVTWNFPFNGLIDDLQIYNRALTDAEIETIYKNRALTLTGDGYHTTAVSNTVTTGSQTPPVATATATSLVATLLPTLFGSVTVNTTATGKTSNSAQLAIVPRLVSIGRTLSVAGHSIHLAGNGFDPTPANNSVSFNGLPASVTASTTTQLTVTVPNGVTAGPIQVTTPMGQSTVANFTPMPTGLISWWQAEGNAQDAMGLNHGTLTNGALIGWGQVGQGYKLDGVDDCILAPDSPSLDFANSHSIGAWVKSTTGGGMIAAKHFTHNNRTTTLYMGASRFQFQIYKPDNTGFTLTSNTAIGANQLYHVFATYDKTSGDASLYVNGVLDKTANFGSFDLMQTDIPFTIGCYLNSADGSLLRDFNTGMLDEVLLFNRALSAAEVLAIYNGSSS